MHAVGNETTSLVDLEARLAALEQLLFGGRWLPVSTVAERLGCSTQTIRNLIHDGRCPARQWRGRYEIDPAWLLGELAQRAKPCPTPVAQQQGDVA